MSKLCMAYLFNVLVAANIHAANVVKIDANVEQKLLERKLFGSNFVYTEEADAYWNDNVLEQALNDLDIGFVRYPGGIAVSMLHYDDPTGQTSSDTWDPNFTGWYKSESKWMNLEEYFDVLTSAGGIPLIGINMQSGYWFNRMQDGLNDAKSLVKYVRDQVGAEYFYLDNEMCWDHFGHGWTDPGVYGDLVRQYAEAIRSVYPNAKIIANWHGYLPDAEQEWLDLLQAADGHVDIMDWHMYTGWSVTNDWQSWYENNPMKHGNTFYDSKFQRFRDLLDNNGYDHVKTAVLEWNVGTPDETLSPFKCTIMNAEAFLHMLSSPLDYACQWKARRSEYDGRMFFATETTGEETEIMPTYYLMDFYKRIQSMIRVQSESNWARTLTVAAKGEEGDQMVVYILRKHDSYAAPIELEVSGFDFDPDRIWIKTLGAEDGDFDAEFVEYTWPSKSVSGNVISFTAAPLTLTRVTLNKL